MVSHTPKGGGHFQTKHVHILGMLLDKFTLGGIICGKKISLE